MICDYPGEEISVYNVKADLWNLFHLDTMNLSFGHFSDTIVNFVSQYQETVLDLRRSPDLSPVDPGYVSAMLIKV